MLSRTQQTVLAQVRIPLCHDNAGMAQYLLHFVQAATRVDKKAGKAVAQVVYAHIGQTSCSACRLPTDEDADEWLLCFWTGKDVVAIGSLANRIQQRQCCHSRLSKL